MSTPATRLGPLVGGHEFSCFVGAAVEHVWTALTASQGPLSTFGLTAASSWRADAPIDWRGCGGSPALNGTVLHAFQPYRLSYILRASTNDPATYVTWLVRTHSIGSIVTLHVDNPGCPENDIDAADIWLPVLAALTVQTGRRNPTSTALGE